MAPSEQFFEFLENEEGFVGHPYKDQAGVPTIGIGTIMYPSGKRVTMADPSITRGQALEYCKWESGAKMQALNGLLRNIQLTQNQFDSLLSFCYNEGVGALSGSTLLKIIRANPNDPATINTADMQDASVQKWLQKQAITSVRLITYYFLVWNKITDPATGHHVFDEGLIDRRMREAKLYFK